MANDSNDTNIKLALTKMPEYIESPLKRSIHSRIKRVLYPSQIPYGSESLPKVSTKASEVHQSSTSTKFVTKCTAKFDKYMI